METWRSAHHRPLTVEIEQEGHSFKVRAGGELDFSNAKLLQGALRRALDSEYPRIILDLQKVIRIDSTGLRVLLWGAQGGRERLRIRLGSSPAVRRLVEQTGVGPALPLTA
jgi:anti-anti-sigma factor